jgi:hypothetical protein
MVGKSARKKLNAIALALRTNMGEKISFNTIEKTL